MRIEWFDVGRIVDRAVVLAEGALVQIRPVSVVAINQAPFL
jgi:hypothetical protein